MTFKSTIGAAGITYRSIAEAAISFPLYDLGIVSRDAYYPHCFVDDEGTSFKAMSDFYCPITNIFFEFKNGYLNGIKSKATADNNLAAFNKADALGFITKKNRNIMTLKAAWSASVPKFCMVQNQLADSGHCVVMVYDVLPDDKTQGRLSRSGAFWCVLGDTTWRAFQQFRTLAKYGFRSEFNINGHQFKSHGGIDIAAAATLPH